MTFDPSKIDPDATYTLTLDRDGWPVQEIDIETGEITEEFLRGPEVCEQVTMSGRELLRVIEAGDRALVTGKRQSVHMFLAEAENPAVGSDGELIETDVTEEAKRDVCHDMRFLRWRGGAFALGPTALLSAMGGCAYRGAMSKRVGQPGPHTLGLKR